MNLDKTALVGFLRGLGFVVLMAVLSFVGDATHLTWLNNAWVEGLISSIVLAIEHGIESNSGKALFGAVKNSRAI